MKKIPAGLGKAAAAATLAIMASVGLLSTTAAGDAEVVTPPAEPAPITAPATAPAEAPAPAEDEPGWDCATMGNMTCGPVAVTPEPEPEPEPDPVAVTPEPFPTYEEAVPWVPGAPHTLPVAPREDEPGFDCRIHGNQMCGVLIEGTWYVVTFRDGLPASVAVR